MRADIVIGAHRCTAPYQKIFVRESRPRRGKTARTRIRNFREQADDVTQDGGHDGLGGALCKAAGFLLSSALHPEDGDSMFATPDEAEDAFYTAFANANLEAMMAVWLESESVICVHPVGPKLTGYRIVRAGWADMFRGGNGLRFRLAEVSRTQDALLAIHVLQEYIRVPGESGERQPMVATNIYQLTQDGWRMILHHASPIAVQNRAEKPLGRLH